MLRAVAGGGSGGSAAGITIGTSIITGGTDTRVLFDDNGVIGEDSGFSYNKTNKAITLGGATVTTSTPALAITQTWNGAAQVFRGLDINITDTSSSALSRIVDARIGGATYLGAGKGASGYAMLWLGPGITPSASNCVIAATTGGVFFQSTVAGDTVNLGDASAAYFTMTATAAANPRARFKSDAMFGFTAGASSAALDSAFARDAAGIIGVRGSTTTTAAGLSFYTYGASPPSAPAASIARLYADTSGGKIRLMALFPSGAAQQIAIEP